MKRFEFQLQTALEWRERRMQTEQARLEALTMRRQTLLTQRESAQAAYAEARTATVGATLLTASDLGALEQFRRATENQKLRIDYELSQLAAHIAKQQKQLVEATREFRLMEKLRDRRLTEWQRELDRRLEEEAAELYLGQWNRY